MNGILEKGPILRRSESISISTTNLIYTGLSVRPLVVIVPFWGVWWASQHCGSHRTCLLHIIKRTQRYILTFRFGVTRVFSDAVEASTFGSLTRHLDTKFIIGFDFAVTLSSPASSCVLFDISSHWLMELKWLMLNKHKRWFHSSRVKFPPVSKSASWFLVSLYLIWILGSKLILSNNQSRATLWVLETCLIVGLLPFMSILITASLSLSNTYNKASWWQECTFEGIKSTLSKSLITLWDSSRPWFVFRSQKSSAGVASNLNPSSKEMFSDSIELCETEVCFLHIQLIGTNVWLPKMHNVPPDVDFESSRSPAKSESWNSPNLHCFAVFPTWQYCLYSLV